MTIAAKNGTIRGTKLPIGEKICATIGANIGARNGVKIGAQIGAYVSQSILQVGLFN